MTTMAMPTLLVYKYEHIYPYKIQTNYHFGTTAKKFAATDRCPRNREIVWTYSVPLSYKPRK